MAAQRDATVGLDGVLRARPAVVVDEGAGSVPVQARAYRSDGIIVVGDGRLLNS